MAILGHAIFSHASTLPVKLNGGILKSTDFSSFVDQKLRASFKLRPGDEMGDWILFERQDLLHWSHRLYSYTHLL